jgi:hypothetical protein
MEGGEGGWGQEGAVQPLQGNRKGGKFLDLRIPIGSIFGPFAPLLQDEIRKITGKWRSWQPSASHRCWSAVGSKVG